MESSKPQLSVTTSIELPHGGPEARLYVDDLIKHVRESGRDYIIQGETDCTLANHPKPNSIDAWLRKKCTSRSDTKQAVNDVIDQLIATRLFKVERLRCPDSGTFCKGIRMLESPKKKTAKLLVPRNNREKS
jgi:hypothetical protein